MEEHYTSKYLDLPLTPLYPFGYGLSYTTFNFDNLNLSSNRLTEEDSLTISVTVKNTGKYDGEEVVQLYVQDLVGSVTRPVKGTKRIQKNHAEKRRGKNSAIHNCMKRI